MAVLRRRRSFLQQLHRHNPFYLLSAASMLLACVLLSNSTSYLPIGLPRLVALIAALSVYELLLVGLGLFLIAKRGLVRDGVMLLALEAFFLADIGFLASEAYTHGMGVGLAVNGVLLTLAAAKIVAILRVLRMPVRSSAFGVVMATLVVLLGHPALLKHVSGGDNGRVPMEFMYALWWAAGGLVAAYALAMRAPGAAVAFRGTRPATRAAGVGHVLAGVLLASLVAHLGTAHWVYKSPFVPADLSPVLAATALLLATLPATRFFRRPEAASCCVVLLAACVLTGVDAPGALSFAAGPVTLTAFSLAVAAAYLVLLDVFFARYFLRMTAAGTMAAGAYAFAPAWESLQAWAAAAYRWVVDVIGALLPRTQTAWGVLAAAGAFVMLAVGAAISLLRPKDDGSGYVADPPAGPPADPPVGSPAEPAPPAVPARSLTAPPA